MKCNIGPLSVIGTLGISNSFILEREAGKRTDLLKVTEIVMTRVNGSFGVLSALASVVL